MAKLTLSINPSVVSRAKRYAKRCGASVSQIVEAYLASVSEPQPEDEIPPVLRSVRGILKKADAGDHRRHLAEKYR